MKENNDGQKTGSRVDLGCLRNTYPEKKDSFAKGGLLIFYPKGLELREKYDCLRGYLREGEDSNPSGDLGSVLPDFKNSYNSKSPGAN